MSQYTITVNEEQLHHIKSGLNVTKQNCLILIEQHQRPEAAEWRHQLHSEVKEINELLTNIERL